eukprot:2881916-Karenia_brevis.AAC.1
MVEPKMQLKPFERIISIASTSGARGRHITKKALESNVRRGCNRNVREGCMLLAPLNPPLEQV